MARHEAWQQVYTEAKHSGLKSKRGDYLAQHLHTCSDMYKDCATSGLDQSNSKLAAAIYT